MHSHTGCICLTFLRCVLSNVSSNDLPEKRHSHIGCICMAFLHCEFSNESSNCLPERMQSHIGCICLAFLHCAFSNVFSTHLHKQMSFIGHMDFLPLRFQMHHKLVYPRGCIVTLHFFRFLHYNDLDDGYCDPESSLYLL